MPTEITLIGNEGFRVTTGSARIYIDAFYSAMPGVAVPPALAAKDVDRADLILVTHAHWDHFAADTVAEVANRTGATVIGAGLAINELRGRLPETSLVQMDPPYNGKHSPAGAVRVSLPLATVTALRTYHSKDHNSYLIQTPELALFHDGDNEDTRRIDLASLGRVDALLIGPWKGSGWVEFVERLSPARYFLMHLTNEELDDHQVGKFLPEICHRVPPGLVMLRPGESFSFE